jgi:hypothetical protein
MVPATKFIAVLSCAIFTGAAVYVSFVEHPARMGLDTKAAAAVWAPSYKRGKVMQASLAVLSFIAGVLRWLFDGGVTWLFAAAIIGSVVPFTLVVILPINHQLQEPDRNLESDETRRLLEKWGRLHAVRSGLGFVASVIYLLLLLQG